MSTPTKKDVIEFLQSDRSLTAGRNLYNRFPNKSLAVQNSLSRMRNTSKNLERLSYELCRLVGIPEQQMVNELKKPITVIVKQEKKNTIPKSRQKSILSLDEESLTFTEDLKALLPKSKEITVPKFEKGKEGLEARILFLKGHNWDHSATTAKALDGEIEKLLKSNKELIKGDIDKILTEREEHLQDVVKLMPNPVKQKIKLWEQFPFLRDKDCPNEFKILVNDMITSYHNYMNAQPGLHDALTDADRKKIADGVKEDFLLNKQIFDELEYYQKNNKPLGNHPIFKAAADLKALQELDGEALSKKITSLENNVRRNIEKSTQESRTLKQKEKSASLAIEQQKLLDIAIEIRKSR